MPCPLGTVPKGSALALLVVAVRGGCRDAGSETLLEHSPDYPSERAADVLDRCAKLGVDLPHAELLDLLTEWDGLVTRWADA